MLNNYQYCIHLNFKNQELTVLIFFFLKEKMAASIFKEMFIMNTFKVLIISFCNGRIDHLAVVNAIFFIMIFHPGIGKYTVCKILFHLIFTYNVFTCEEITSSNSRFLSKFFSLIVFLLISFFVNNHESHKEFTDELHSNKVVYHYHCDWSKCRIV